MEEQQVMLDSETEEEIDQKQLDLTKTKDFDDLMFALQEKFKTAIRKEKINILTLKQNSWSYRKTAVFFDTSLYLVQQSLKLQEQKGILAQPIPIKPKTKMSEEVKQKVTEFYLDDEHSFSRIMPGLKDKVS